MTTLSQMFADDHRRNLEWARGAIVRMPNLWQLADDDAIKAELSQGDKTLIIRDDKMWKLRENGDLIVLVKRKAVICPNKELWPGTFESNGGCWIPESDCRKCQFYRKADRYRYSTCEWAHQERTGGKRAEQVAAQASLDALTGVIRDAAEIMR